MLNPPKLRLEVTSIKKLKATNIYPIHFSSLLNEDKDNERLLMTRKLATLTSEVFFYPSAIFFFRNLQKIRGKMTHFQLLCALCWDSKNDWFSKIGGPLGPGFFKFLTHQMFF